MNTPASAVAFGKGIARRLGVTDGRIVRALASGMAWSLIGTVASRAVAVGGGIVIARVLGQVDLGKFAIVNGTLGMVQTFAGLGLGVTATRYVAAFRDSDPARVARILAMARVVAVVTGTLVAGIVALGADLLAARVLAASDLAVPLRITCISLLLGAVNGAQSGALSGFEAFRTIAGLNAVVSLVSTVALMFGALAGGVEGAAWGGVVSTATTCAAYALALRREAAKHGIPPAGDWRAELPVFWHFSVPSAIAGILVGPATWVCSALLVNRPRGYAEMGALNVANQWFSYVSFLPGLLAHVTLPVLSREMGARNARGITEVLRTATWATLFSVVPLLFAVSLASRWILALYGEGFESYGLTLVLSVSSALAYSLCSPVGDVIAATGRMWIGTALNAVWAVAVVALTYLLVHKGAEGVAGARLASYLLHTGLTAAVAFRLLRAGAR